jgi:Protein of unknown function (DUF2867)
MKLPNSAHESGPWRIREIASDIPLEDVWALPAHGDAEDFQSLLRLLAASDPAEADSGAARFLWQLRDRLGSWFDLGRIAAPADGAGGGLTIPGTDEASLADRLPDDLRGTAADLEFASLPFEPLYRTNTEFAAEISNRTVYGVMHLGWAEQGDGRYQAQMAVYVMPRGLFGRAYMAAIKPFRYLIVYPALMRQIERTWNARGPKQAAPA